MKVAPSILVFALAVGFAGTALASCVDDPVPSSRNDCNIWIDTNGDGLPGPNIKTTLGQSTSCDVWVDSKTFEWTTFNIALDFGGEPGDTYFSTDTADVDVILHISGGIYLSEDDVTLATGFVFAGIFFAPHSGQTDVATLILEPRRTAPDFAACIVPVVDIDAPIFCQLLAGDHTSYGIFCGGIVSPGCYTINEAPTSNETASWGAVKSLFR